MKGNWYKRKRQADRPRRENKVKTEGGEGKLEIVRNGRGKEVVQCKSKQDTEQKARPLSVWPAVVLLVLILDLTL